jgi:hypothetical protein
MLNLSVRGAQRATLGQKILGQIVILASAILVTGCEQTFNLTPESPTSPGAINVTNTNTNTNTNTTTTDRTGSDVGNNPNSPNTPPSTDLPLPSYGEATVRSFGVSDADALAKSCQLVYGESAWTWLDKVISSLQQRDARWGYMCKDNECTNFARDIVAYKAGNTNLGIWIVDVIGNHCPNPGDVVTATWQVLPFETVRQWRFSRK